jgi:hypothetical protein
MTQTHATPLGLDFQGFDTDTQANDYDGCQYWNVAGSPKLDSSKESWAYSQYDTKHDHLQAMAVAVAWKSFSTRTIRMDFSKRALYMADIIQVCMLAAYEPTTMADLEKALYTTTRDSDTAERVYAYRDGAEDWTPEEIAEKTRYKHIESAMKAWMKSEFAQAHTVVMDDATEEIEKLSYVVARRSDVDRDLPEMDRLDILLARACDKMPTDKMASTLRKLVYGEISLADVNSTTRAYFRSVVGSLVA